jgi:ATP/maltotriose-dependent transcriptional regulator MalT
MDQGNAGSQSSTPELIDRPRLRALVDESRAPVILLVAPAGYGKTTLARQWVIKSGRHAAWYTCTTASADVAALALGLARTAAEIFPNAAHRLASRLRSTTSVTGNPAALAELLIDASSPAPDEACLVLDDYHYLRHSEPAEQLVGQMVSSQRFRVLVATRRRPSWATARRLLYGELYEIPRALLAMTENEAAEVLKNKGPQARTLIEIADGWPAVIGLAAKSDILSLPTDKLAPQLYDFFAQELYQAAPQDVQRDLHRLSMIPSTSNDHLRLVFPDRADSVVDELTRLGFLTSSSDRTFGNETSVDLHPLVRDFVADKVADLPKHVVEAEAREVAQLLSDSSAWDDSFAVIRRFELGDLLPDLVERALESLLEQGRTTTIDQWLTLAHQLKLRSPVLDLANAELALRRGAWREALVLGSNAGDAFPDRHWLTSRALNCAARAAHFSDQGDVAVALHTRARTVARRPQDVRESLWGKFVSQSEVELPHHARSTLDEYERLEVCDGDDLLRRTTGRLVLAIRHGPLHEVLRIAPAALSVLDSAEDPITRTGFLQMYTYAMALAGRYREAHASGLAEIDAARNYDLEFIEIHALCALAMADVGLRQFASAEAGLDRADVKLRSVDDVHAEMALSALRMKIGLIRGDDALLLGEVERVWPRDPNSGLQGALVAVRGLVYARKGNHALAQRSAAAAERITRQLEARLTAKCVYAASAAERQSVEAESAALAAFEAARSTGAFDPFVITYRAFPSVLQSLAGTAVHDQVGKLVDLVGDRDIGVRSGIIEHALPQSLSRREREVLELLGHGLSNRAIAKALWISESTAKVHVRHIFDKLKVRTRTEAALAVQGRVLKDSSD